MAKSSLPKVISKANKEIASIIEQDIETESKLLKDLVDQVLAANMEVKKKNNQRINETRKKLQDLDIEIDELNKSIDIVDRETVLEQLNEMIDAENKIFAARQEIRFFDNAQLSDTLAELDAIYTNLVDSISNTRAVETTYQQLLKTNNDMLFDKQVAITTAIIEQMQQLYAQKEQYAMDQITATSTIKQDIIELENQLSQILEDHHAKQDAIQANSLSIFTEVDDEILLGEKVAQQHEKTLQDIAEKKQQINDKYHEKRQQIIDGYKAYEQSVRDKLEAQNQQELLAEREEQKKKEEQLKNIRLLIIDAEKKQDFNKVQTLMKQFEKIEKSNVARVTDKTDKLLAQETKKTHEKAIKQLKTLELKYVQDMNKQELNYELEHIKFEESKILYKIKSDHQALLHDQQITKDHIHQLQSFLSTKLELTKQLYQLKTTLRIAELDIMMENEKTDHTLIDGFKTLLQELKEVERKRLLALQENVNHHEIIKIDQQYHIGKTVLDLKLHKQLTDIDQRILKTRNESLIKIEKMKEEANSEIIYQESLIKIAQKERELQLTKVHSLYENERSLAEEQVERINLGIQVNDAFVKTTLQNQILFAQQQINCAESEFDIRVENINLTKEQELAYANKKIDYYRQKYEYEKSKLRKELNDKLEDLNFKLLLFTDKKENQSIQAQINQLQDRYQAMIDEIDVQEEQDAEIKRYEIVITAAEERARQAIEEASALKEQTTAAFEALLDQTQGKFQQIEQNNHSQDTVGIMPLLNSGAISSADQRLQKAISEAEELYNDRIIEPNRIINKTKQELLDMTNDEETEAFIQQQKALKKEKIQEHSDLLEELHQIREESLEGITDEVDRAKLMQQKVLEQQTEYVINAPLYRDDKAIERDYEALKQKERSYYDKQLGELNRFISQELVEHKKVLKETNALIKAVNKPYKKYIRKASRGLNAEKRELIRKNKRVLRKALSDAEAAFDVEL
ncbi:hypothetical protein [Candidatus Xianfuyuplasma coldseepsis]|uniref:Uncharacterized protein n=1 Tax=Candidatus Xianfuyuplasma coldseepsis TaxID=2782163 RepID=A0A7L7KU74_9MOLU|nr:hypothetical protein [Xianfuyuplasma coldseepsis]QMS85852.1 hypothetical protein G4Z02_08865 [Xianfuyuplasma coldseepsis]